MSDIFISYAREDREQAETLATRLTEAGWSVWWDPEIRAGEHFAEVIEEALHQVRAVIVLWSRNSVTSRWVRAEANEGLRQEKLIPLALDTAEPPLIFKPIHTGQFANWNGSADAPEFHKLIGDIRDRVGDGSTPPEQMTSDTRPGHGNPVNRPLAVSLLALLCVLLLMAMFDLPGHTMDWISGMLGQSGNTLPAALVQAALLSAMIAALVLLRGHYWPVARKQPMGLAIGFGLMLSAATILYHWVDYLVWSSDHLGGRVSATPLDGIRVLARDHRHQQMSLGDMPIDTRTGEFTLRYTPEFGARPRYLSVMKPGCRDLSYPVSRDEWRAVGQIEIPYTCEAER